jgi:hypothetical protein
VATGLAKPKADRDDRGQAVDEDEDEGDVGVLDPHPRLGHSEVDCRHENLGANGGRGMEDCGVLTF